MEWKNQLSRTPLLVLFIMLITVGVGTASALLTITLSGDVIATGNLNVEGTLSSPTVNNLQSQISSIDGRISVLEGP